jgi:hypothetical protein
MTFIMVLMRSCSRENNPRFLLCIVAALLAFVVQSGELGSADTQHRLQTAHSFWTSEPAVFPNEYPAFGVHGRGGKLYDWYGIGQVLLMLPFDIAATYIENLPIFAGYDSDPTVRNIFVSYTTNIFITVLTALVCFRLLEQLGFSIAHSVAGALGLLFATTHLHYTQNMMENNYICLLTLTGFSYQYRWLRSASRRALIIGSAAFGLNLLTRLTSALDLFFGGVFLFLILWFENAGKQEFWRKAVTYGKTAVPVYLLFFAVDRLYQFYRFGTWTDTYVRYFTLERRLQDPTLAANYPWETPFHVGFLGPLISPEKSIFMFDPLIILTVVVTIFSWRRLSSALKAYTISAFLLVLGYICFYARYTVWSGNFAWGDRYVSTAVELAAFISVPILLRYRASLVRVIWSLGIALVVLSVTIQIASLAFWMPLEIYQADDFGHPQFVIWLRFKNIVAFALGKMDAWGLNTDSMGYDQWDYQHITTWNFLPFLLRRMGAAPNWAVDAILSIWLTAIVALIYTLSKIQQALKHTVRGRPQC